MTDEGGEDALRKILNYMTSQQLFLFQFERARKVCQKHLITLYPELAEQPEDKERLSEKEVDDYVSKMHEKLGEYLEITPLPPGEFEYRDPVEELGSIMGKENVFAIEMDIEELDEE